jgi:putative transposase
MGRNEDAWAVFRCALLNPLMVGEVEAADREAFFRSLAADERLLPNGRRKRISVRTLRRWWQRLRDEGVSGTFRRRRKDRGQPRASQQQRLARAVELKREQPRRSHVVINRILKQEFGRGVPRSTLYRHLHREGATRRKLGVSQEKIRCRWTRDASGALWVGDFEHGPPVLLGGRAMPTRLCVWIDCHSRYVVEARYYLAENLDVLVDSLLRAWGRHGASRELYVDNAKIYHAHALDLACTQLHIKLLHRPPRDPPAGGLIERIIQTIQGQLEAEVRAAQLISLAEINLALQAWLAEEYHAAVHSETGEPPAQRYDAATNLHRPVRLQSVVQLFFEREQRKVDHDFCDVRVNNVFFAVDAKYRGDRLEVRWDPFQNDQPLQEVELYSLDGRYLGVGRRYQREKGFHPQPEVAAPQLPIEPAYIDALLASHRARQQQRRETGLDFHSAAQRSVWAFSSFAAAVARALGRAGGLSALSPDELDGLRLFHARHDCVNESLLRAAVAEAAAPTIPHVLLSLQSRLSQGDA